MTSHYPTRPTSLAEWDERIKQTLSARFQESDKATETFQPLSTDLFISPYAKCGTTWMQQIVHGLRTRGDMDFDDISRVVPWLGVSGALGLDINAAQQGSFRAFKSHESWHKIPKGARYLVSLRDPKDALVSAYRFSEGWTFAVGSVSIAEFAQDAYLKDRGAPGSYWYHLLSWWEQRHNPALLLLCYEDTKQDLAGTIRKIANFLNIALDEELMDIVLRQSSLDFMLKHKDKFDDFLLHNLFIQAGILPPGGDSAKVRKGEVGQHHYELPTEISAEMDAIWHEEITAKLGFANYQELRAALRKKEVK